MNFFDRKYLPFIIIFAVVFISRLPFLSAGYGVEEDSWGIALAAFHTKLSGVYEPSRFPGHPVQELVFSVLWGCGPIIFNGLCAFFSAVAAVFFSLILKQLKFQHFFIAALAFAFIPVFYISSTYTIDFVWTAAFILIAFYFLLKEQFLIVGVFLGLAIGCRVTSGAMLLPFMIISWKQENIKANVIRFIKIVAPMTVIAVISFSPIIKQFGLSFFMYYDQFPYPPMTKVIYKMTLGVFGCIGLLAIAICKGWIILNRKKGNFGALFQYKLDKKIIVASYVTVVLFIISYFRLPQKSGYMISILPFVILLFGYFLNSRMFKFLCLAFIFSSFVCSINLTDRLRGAMYSNYSVLFKVSGQEIFFDPISGPVFSDYSKRLQKMKYTKELIEQFKVINSKTVLITGWWYNEILVTAIPDYSNNIVIIESYINSEKMNQYISKDYVIKYLPEQNIYNDQMFKMDVTEKIASSF
ncbi:MAG: hypothetical protein NTX97_05215 [Bacteroidetes bacterium]|nr:hypothetical protein [Bacteroidota bacterium]